jgi:hypothetical protein
VQAVTSGKVETHNIKHIPLICGNKRWRWFFELRAESGSTSGSLESVGHKLKDRSRVEPALR